MNYKLLIGQMISKVDVTVRKSKIQSINKFYPWGRDFIFDLKRILGPKVGCIIDAGANVGSVSKEFNFFFPDSDIYSFEPIKSTFALLKNNTLHLSKIHPKNLALGEFDQELKIAIYSEHTINSIVSQPTGSYIKDYETIQVVSLDNFAICNKIQNVEVLKIDVEGYEFKVLNGAEDLIKKSLNAIILEVGYERCNHKVHFSDVESYMEKHGFQCCGIYDITKSTNKRKLNFSNNLYIRQDLL